jgi:dimethylhistidine N-methyltransferase
VAQADPPAAPGADAAFRDAVLAGLSQRSRVIPARYFYDAEGSRLFEAITRQPEYYPTATEIGILRDAAIEIAAAIGPGRAVVEFGSGSSEKTPPLLRAIGARLYIPVDISPSALAGAEAMLAERAPGVAVHPVVADFLGDWAITEESERYPLLGYFPGSTIGNMGPAAAVDLLRHFRARLGEDALCLIGIDRRKEPAVLESAYNDRAGVTAAFNRNLLARMARDLGASLDIGAWAHRAWWRDPPGRIEMHLEATRATAIALAGHRFEFAAGETIHTENSHKYSAHEADFLARASGWAPIRAWTDARDWFGLHLWRAAPRDLEP